MKLPALLLQLIIIQVTAQPVRLTQPTPLLKKQPLQNLHLVWLMLSSTTGHPPFLSRLTFLLLRIPKTGSENMAYIIKQLAKQNEFQQRRIGRNGRGPLTREQARKLEGELCSRSQPTIFDEHLHFLPTSPSCDNLISWITMVGKLVASKKKLIRTDVTFKMSDRREKELYDVHLYFICSGSRSS